MTDFLTELSDQMRPPALSANPLSVEAQNLHVPGDTVRLSAAMMFARIAGNALAGSGTSMTALLLLLRATAVTIGERTTAKGAASSLRRLADELDPPEQGAVC